jgi:hypothetical protein
MDVRSPLARQAGTLVHEYAAVGFEQRASAHAAYARLMEQRGRRAEATQHRRLALQDRVQAAHERQAAGHGIHEHLAALTAPPRWPAFGDATR